MARTDVVYKVDLKLLEPMLGTAPLDPNLYTNYIATKRAELENNPLTPEELEEELETLREDKGKTGFHRDKQGQPCIYDYMIIGTLKEACSILRMVSGTISSDKKYRAYKKIIGGTVFVTPRLIQVNLSGPITVKERALRAQTMQGERIALAASEMVPAGSFINFEIRTIGELVTEDFLRELLDYGRYHGLGQWRSARWGSFEYEMKRV